MAKRRQFGSIRRLPSKRWQARYTTPNGKTVTAPKTFAAKLHAEAWLADRKREIDTKLWNPDARRPQRTLFAAYAALWLKNRQARGNPGSGRAPASTTRRSSTGICCPRSVTANLRG